MTVARGAAAQRDVKREASSVRCAETMSGGNALHRSRVYFQSLRVRIHHLLELRCFFDAEARLFQRSLQCS